MKKAVERVPEEPVEGLQQSLKILEEEDPERFDFHEYGLSYERSKTYFVTRSFSLPTCDGPPTPIPTGSRVRLGDRNAQTLFQGGKIEPVVMPTEFEVLHPFSSIDSKGEWVTPDPGDIVKMEKEEALKLWRSGHIKPTRKEDFII